MNTAVTSAEALLKASKEIAAEKGIGSINIRNVAERAHVSVGSVYNYFESKEILVSETIAAIWCDIFRDTNGCLEMGSFHDGMVWLIGMIDKCGREYPDILTAHPYSIHGDLELKRGRRMMEQYLTHVIGQLKYVLEQDRKIKQGVFDDSFTEDEFIDFVFSNVVMSAKCGNRNMAVLVKLIDKILYEG